MDNADNLFLDVPFQFFQNCGSSHFCKKIVELETGPFKVHICCGSIGQPVANYQNSYLEPRLRDIKQGTVRHWNTMINKQFSLATISKFASFGPGMDSKSAFKRGRPRISL